MDSQQIVDMVKLIQDAGIMVVIAAIFLVIVIVIFKKEMKQNQQMFDKIINDNKQASKHHPEPEDVAVLDIINDKIYKELLGALGELSADRGYVYLYHNGGVSSSGLFFQKMSCICEVVGQGILPVAPQEQGLYRASYSSLCEGLKTSDQFVVPDQSRLKGTDNFMYQTLWLRHAQSVYCSAFKDSQGNVIGFVGIDYCSTNEEVSEKKITDYLKEVAFKISSLVDVRDEIQ